MKTIYEIETMIERLPAGQVDELADWLDAYRARRVARPSIDAWLNREQGTARPGVCTAEVMALTRGEE